MHKHFVQITLERTERIYLLFLKLLKIYVKNIGKLQFQQLLQLEKKIHLVQRKMSLCHI